MDRVELPDVLVLGAGGAVGEAWMTGLLGGLGLDFRECEYFVGTSAGAVVAATLAAGREPRAVEGAAAAEGVSVNTWLVRALSRAASTKPRHATGRRLTGYGRS
jgi:predicted acylesterase/phospholipase RssA